MKLWILDADVIIELLGLGIFDKLVSKCKIFLSTTVVDEVKHYNRPKDGVKVPVDFRSDYVDSELVSERSASVQDLQEIIEKLPTFYKDGIHEGELESLAFLNKNRDFLFCSIDHTVIRALPFLELSENGFSLESFLKQSGFTIKNPKDTYTDSYYESNLNKGKELKIQYGQF